jgi:Subtilase family
MPNYFLAPNYLTLSGTSMASAVTSGAVALLLSAQSALTPDQVKARLMLTASKTFTSFGANYFSYMTEAQNIQQQITTIQTLTLPALQNAANQASESLNHAAQTLNQDQQAQQQAAQAVPPAQNSVNQAQAALNAAELVLAAAQATSTLANDNANLAQAQTNYNTAVIPSNNLAAEQSLLATLQQQYQNYIQLARNQHQFRPATGAAISAKGADRNSIRVASARDRRAAGATKLEQRHQPVAGGPGRFGCGYGRRSRRASRAESGAGCARPVQQTYSAAQTLDSQLWTAGNTAQTTLNTDNNAANQIKQQMGNPGTSATQQAQLQAQYNQLAAQVAADTTAYNNAVAAAKAQDSVVQTDNSALNTATQAVQQAQSASSKPWREARRPQLDHQSIFRAVGLGEMVTQRGCAANRRAGFTLGVPCGPEASASVGTWAEAQVAG